MAIASTDLVFYASASMPEDDSTTSGGTIDRDTRIVFTDISADDTVEIVSSAVGDTTQGVTITGRRADGVIVSEAETLNGTTAVTTTQSFERILKVVMNSDATGTVTVRKQFDNVTIGAIPPGERGFRRPFYDATAYATGGGTKTLYEKIILANNHTSLSLLNATVEATSDPSAILSFRLEDARNDNNSTTNRLTEPTGMDANSWDDSEKSVPGGYLGDATTSTEDEIGVWLRLSLSESETPGESSYTLTVSGSST